MPPPESSSERPPPLPFSERELRSWRLLEDFRRALADALRAHPEAVRRPRPNAFREFYGMKKSLAPH